MRGCVVKNADGSQFLGQRVVSIIKLFQFQDIVSSDDHQQFLVGDAQHLVRSQQPSAPLALRLTVLGDDPVSYTHLDVYKRPDQVPGAERLHLKPKIGADSV